MPKYVAWGRYCDNVVEKRAPYRQAHLDGLSDQKRSGVLVTIGPTQDLSMFFAIYDVESEAAARALIESDPYWKHDIWTEYFVKEWIQAL